MCAAKYKEKFIVINKKHLGKLNKEFDVNRFLSCLAHLDLPNHRYIACNQNEPYAHKVLAVILQGEDLKEADKICRENATKNYKGR